MELKLRDFESKILYFNGMYKLPIGGYPTTFRVIADEQQKRPIQSVDDNPVRGKHYVMQRLNGFIKTITDETKEGFDILNNIERGYHEVEINGVLEKQPYTELDFLTDLADWLGDIIVYCSSEMAKFGLPVNDVLSIIMQSNFTKLQKDGTAIYDSEGKVIKGPYYFKPEPAIKSMLENMIKDNLKQPITEELNEDERPK